MIVVMLRTSPQRRRKATAAENSSSGQPLHDGTSGAQPYRPRAHTSAGPIAEAYAKFLGLPVPVVFVGLWLFGAVLLGVLSGVVLVAAYWTEMWLLAAMSLLL